MTRHVLTALGLVALIALPGETAAQRRNGVLDSVRATARRDAVDTARGGGGSYFVVGFSGGMAAGALPVFVSKGSDLGVGTAVLGAGALLFALFWSGHDDVPHVAAVTPPALTQDSLAYRAAFDAAHITAVRKQRRTQLLRGAVIGAAIGLLLSLDEAFP